VARNNISLETTMIRNKREEEEEEEKLGRENS
jgi:hypothetical protein